MGLALSAADHAAGQGRLLVAVVATVLTAFILDIRHITVLNMLDARRWAGSGHLIRSPTWEADLGAQTRGPAASRRARTT